MNLQQILKETMKFVGMEKGEGKLELKCHLTGDRF